MRSVLCSAAVILLYGCEGAEPTGALARSLGGGEDSGPRLGRPEIEEAAADGAELQPAPSGERACPSAPDGVYEVHIESYTIVAGIERHVEQLQGWTIEGWWVNYPVEAFDRDGEYLTRFWDGESGTCAGSVALWLPSAYPPDLEAVYEHHGDAAGWLPSLGFAVSCNADDHWWGVSDYDAYTWDGPGYGYEQVCISDFSRDHIGGTVLIEPPVDSWMYDKGYGGFFVTFDFHVGPDPDYTCVGGHCLEYHYLRVREDQVWDPAWWEHYDDRQAAVEE